MGFPEISARGFPGNRDEAYRAGIKPSTFMKNRIKEFIKSTIFERYQNQAKMSVVWFS